mmetsp:Transcript_63715/g.143729  ORF Transcript_63715/g.143729 Transcript_63715/m.143729 type:complete len:202 (+) Transcript_63715:718-1323(+)
MHLVEARRLSRRSRARRLEGRRRRRRPWAAWAAWGIMRGLRPSVISLVALSGPFAAGGRVNEALEGAELERVVLLRPKLPHRHHVPRLFALGPLASRGGRRTALAAAAAMRAAAAAAAAVFSGEVVDPDGREDDARLGGEAPEPGHVPRRPTRIHHHMVSGGPGQSVRGCKGNVVGELGPRREPPFEAADDPAGPAVPAAA